jgi:acetyl esterase/lipase
VSIEQQETLDAILRQSALPVGSSVDEQRRLLKELVSAQPLPAEVTVTAAALGGVPTAEVTVDGIEPGHAVLYFHGGVYVIGDAFLAAELASQVGRRTQARVISVDYRLAPERRIRQRLRTPLRPIKRCCRTASPRRTSSSRESPPAAASP